jgi:hypothetical protein
VPQEPVLDGRRVESLVQELHRYAPQYTPELNVADQQGAGPALMRIFAHVTETVLVRLAQTPRKLFIAFLDRLGISLLPARPARAAVTFRLSSDLTDVVLVPAGTRVTAAGEDDDIPFETTSELMAIPGGISVVYGTDPVRDVIYRPPPGFLEPRVRNVTELVYKALAFTTAGERRLQLDHVTELAPGSFLRIGERDQAVVESIADGNIVTLEDPLGRDVDANTILSPIHEFEVFSGIDVQEHVLYLGHADVFTVKEQADLTVDVELAGGQGAGLAPLDIAWQFWTTVNLGAPNEEDRWSAFSIVSDGTGGLSTSGRLVLGKPAGVEIKEVERSGVKSRWIRAVLLDKLPADGRPLPEIDTIAVGVKSDPTAGIPADQAFHNATPLDLQVDPDVGILPFGLEPRQFDQFYLASGEAFSKRAAQVRLQFELDLQTLAGPSLAATTTGAPLLRAYSIGLRRRVYELLVDTGDWRLLGEPSAVAIDERPKGSGFLPIEDSTPAAFFEGEDLFVFVNTEDSLATQNPANRIWCFFRQGNQAEGVWNDLGAPGPTPPVVHFSPAALRLTSGAFGRVFAVAGDGKLYSRGVTNTGVHDEGWVNHAAPPGVTLSSRPFVATAATGDVLVFVNGNGVVHRFLLRSDMTSEWLSLEQQTTLFTAAGTPFAVPFGAGVNAKVFVVGVSQATTQAALFECDTSAGVNGEFDWVDLGLPGDADLLSPADHSPAGFLEAAGSAMPEEGKHIYLRGPDNRLYELMDGETPADPPLWEDRSRPADPPLRDSPVVHVDSSASTNTIRVLSASGRNSIVSWDFELSDAPMPANADALAVRLDDAASGADDHYTGDFAIPAGPGSPVAGNAVEAYDGALKVVRLATALATAPDSSSTCDIDGEPVSIASTGADRLLALHDRPDDDDFRRGRALRLRLDDDVVLTEFYSRLTGVVRLSAAVPAAGNYVLYTEVLDVTTEYAPLEDRGSIPALSWEYWNGRGWLSLPVSDATRNFLANGEVAFTVPESIAPTEVAGQQNFWIRARLVGGDYGRETFKVDEDNTVVSEKSSLRPPRITSLRLFYDAPGVLPEACLTFNNLDYLNQTAACRIGGARFFPFEPLERFADRSVTLFLGFERPFRTGPVRLLIDAAEREFDERRPPEFDWRFRKDRRWKPLDADDGSAALTRPGILTLSAGEALTRESRFGQSRFWIAGSLRTDRGPSAYPSPLLRGIFLNTVWALQGETITDEILGSSDGEPNQVARFQYADVFEGEDVRVREALSDEEHEQIVRESGPDSIVRRDDLGGTWVRWRATTAIFDAGRDDRCYVIDRAAGQVQFGDGSHGRIPPAGVDNIRTFRYRTGGGAIGNVAAGKIEALGTAVAGVESVFNPTAAGGGSDKATTEAMLTIGPRRLSHRDRAVAAADFEELALEASRQVAKVRCLATTNLVRRGAGAADPCDAAQRHEARRTAGWVSLIVVPDTADPRPCPSLELRRTVKDYLRQRAPSVLASGDRIVIRPPDYVDVSVEAEIFVTSLEHAAAAESKARATLERFLHPLRGGPDGAGWEFGRPLWKSDVFSALEDIAEIDRIEHLQFHCRGRTDGERVVIGPHELLASGSHLLVIKKA